MLKSFRIDSRLPRGSFPKAGTTREKMMYLLRYAVLAPSIHNTQPWKFSVDRGRIGIFADRTRWLAAADPDERDMRMSLGCALENLLVAARHHGYDPVVTYAPRAESPDFVALVDLSRQDGDGANPGPGLESLRLRRTLYRASDSREATPVLLESLARVCADAGARLQVSADTRVRSAAARLFREANARQFADPRYRAEAAEWLRKGEYGLPRLQKALGRAGIEQLEQAIERESDMIAAAPYFAVILTESDDPVSHLRAGQAFERVWLAAAAAKVGLRPASALCEVPAIRAKLAQLVAAGPMKVVQAFRLGYGEPRGKPAPRRKVDDSIVAVPLN